eukprot:8801650-Pyramimonas_sp.AAC.1
MSVPVAEQAGLFKDYLVKVVTKSFLQLGKEGHAKTLGFCSAAIGEIKAMPMTCDAVVDAAAAEVIAALQLVMTITGSTRDAVPLST